MANTHTHTHKLTGVDPSTGVIPLAAALKQRRMENQSSSVVGARVRECVHVARGTRHGVVVFFSRRAMAAVLLQCVCMCVPLGESEQLCGGCTMYNAHMLQTMCVRACVLCVCMCCVCCACPVRLTSTGGG